MDNLDRNEFGIVISAMLETFGQEATKAKLLGYWLGLNELSLAQVQNAVTLAIRRCRYLPTPAEIRELVAGGSSTDLACLAWLDVLNAVPNGPYRHLDFADGVINATIRSLGGWVTFLSRLQDAESEKWARKDFCDTYTKLFSSGVNGEIMRPLSGLSERCVKDGKVVEPIPLRIECSVKTQHERIEHNSRISDLVPGVHLEVKGVRP